MCLTTFTKYFFLSLISVSCLVCIQVDILSKLPKTEFNQKLAATKWSEILEGLNIAVDMIGAVPKLTAGDYGDLVQKVKRLGDHSHFQARMPFVTALVQCYGTC